MPEKSIISRPVYGTLSPQPGREHLFVADAQGAEAILDMAAAAPEGFFAGAQIVYIPRDADPSLAEKLKALSPAMFYEGPSVAAAMPRLRQTLATARMGLRVYLAGTEGLIGQAMQAALEARSPAASSASTARASPRTSPPSR